MKFNEIRCHVKEITKITSLVPEPLQQKCFEILLTQLLREMENLEKQPTTPTPPVAPAVGKPSDKSIPTPAQIRVFMQRQDISQTILQSLIMYAGGEVHFIREPSNVSVAEGQIQWALLLALKNGILSNSLEVDPEDVRSVCQEKGFYDAANFAAIFKRKSNAKSFKGPLKPQGEPQQLSSEGEIELAELIRSLSG